jgi:hypothetical protein
MKSKIERLQKRKSQKELRSNQRFQRRKNSSLIDTLDILRKYFIF